MISTVYKIYLSCFHPHSDQIGPFKLINITNKIPLQEPLKVTCATNLAVLHCNPSLIILDKHRTHFYYYTN